MKHFKQIITRLNEIKDQPSAELDALIWQFICYPPKMPLRQHQEQLLNEAQRFSLKVNDPHFSNTELKVNGFVWGTGKRKIIITHGWGSKAADFNDVITALRQLDNVQIISWDAPGNGSSEGGLSNLLLFVQAIRAVIETYGEPDVLIGHSIGAMANVIALSQLEFNPSLLISISPLIRLKENFEASMTMIGIPESTQAGFLKSFEEKYGFSSSIINMNDVYTLSADLNHWLVYDELDFVSPYVYMDAFLKSHPTIKTLQCDGAGHDRIIKSPDMIEGLVEEVQKVL